MAADDKSHRDIILRRRMFLVSSALSTALVGCPPDTPQPVPPTSSTPVATVEPVGSGTQPQPAPPPDPEPPPKIPSLEVPAGINPTARANYESLAAEVPLVHAELDAADKASLKLCFTGGSCEENWSALAAHLAKARDMQQDLSPRCHGDSADAKQFYERLAKHISVIEERHAAIKKRIDRALDTDSRRQRWEKLKADAAIPQPCLKYGCDDW